MKRRFRLTRSTDFKRVRQFGKSYAHPLAVLVLAANPVQTVRVGVVAGLRVGGAVQRNRAKRQMRAALQALFPHLQPGWDLIFIARQPIARARFAEIQAALTNLVERAGIYRRDGMGSERITGLSE